MKFAALVLSFLSLSAFAESSQLLGTWSSACTNEDGLSYVNRMTYLADGKIKSEDLMYDAEGCAGAPRTETSMGSYKVESEDANSAVVAISPDSPVEGDPVFLKVRLNFTNSTTAMMKLLAATVIVDGRQVEIPAAQIDAIPAVTYTRY